MPAFGTPRAPRTPLRPGHRLDGRYELLLPYAQGGMATVWVARVQGKHGFEKLYAVKTILPHLAEDASFRTMFLDEARIASRIRHGNVAAIEDLGEHDGQLYMVLEWIQGDAWSKLVTAVTERGDPIPVDLMVRIAAHACAGLHAAHELKDERGGSLDVVHRDVSPQNIMVGDTGVVKVIDFGIAKAVGRASEATRTGLIKGRLEYLAPELAAGREVDRRADVWAVGATLYQVLAGRVPFTGKNDLDVLRRISSGKPPAPLPSRVPRPVADVVMHALRADLGQRVQSALDLQRLLESVMTSPVPPEEITRAVSHYLGPRVQSRRTVIGDALRDAGRRHARSDPPEAKVPVAPGVAPRPVALGPTASEPWIAPVAAGGTAAIPGEPSADPIEAAVRLSPLHAAWIALATLITLGVWSMVIARALVPEEASPSREGRATPPSSARVESARAPHDSP